jgi:hypothetical protein
VLEEMERDIAVTSGSLQTELEVATKLRAGWNSAKAAEILQSGDYDQAPVMSGSNLIGYVLRSELEKRPDQLVRASTRNLNQSVLLSADAPLRALLDVLRRSRFAFVVGGSGVTGFATPSDLNKHAARAHFYLLLARLEIAASDLLRRSVGPGSMLALLGPSARATIERRYREDKSADVDVDYVAYLDFSQLLNVIGRLAGVRSGIGFPTPAAWSRATRGLVGLRRDVMHPVRQFYGPGRSVDDLIAADDRIRDLLVALFARQPKSTSGPVGAHNPTRELKRAVSVAISNRTQPVTPADMAGGRIRIPAAIKAIFPSVRGPVSIVLRAEPMTVPYDPRNGSDRNRSGLLSIGRSPLGKLVSAHEVLAVKKDRGVFYLD